MAKSCTNSRYFSGQGSLLMGLRDATTGLPTGLRPLGNVPAASLGITTSEFEHKESCTGVRGIDKTIIQEVNVTLDFTLESFDRENFAIGLYGNSALVAAGTVTDESVKGYIGYWMPVANIAITNLVLTTADGLTTYVEGTDYSVNEDAGSFRVTEGGGIAEGAELLADYDYGEQDNIDALMTSSAPDRYFRFEGLNTAEEDKPVIIDLFKVNTQPLAALALIQDELGAMEINSKVLSDPLRATGSKFFRVRQAA